jgi:hypothetical protein
MRQEYSLCFFFMPASQALLGTRVGPKNLFVPDNN